MKKNLILISQFCTSNHVLIEFLPSYFLVKELSTRTILLKDRTKDGVYEWLVSPPKSPPLLFFSNVKTIWSKWHYRLGHFVFPILKHMVSSYKLDLSSSPLYHVCNCIKRHKWSFNTFYHSKFFLWCVDFSCYLL